MTLTFQGVGEEQILIREGLRENRSRKYGDNKYRQHFLAVLLQRGAKKWVHSWEGRQGQERVGFQMREMTQCGLAGMVQCRRGPEGAAERGQL